MTQKCLITNEELFLDEVINKTLPGSENLFFLVGYFYFSGFEKIYQNLMDKNIKILVGMDIEKDFRNKFKEYELIEKVISSRGKIKSDFYRSFVQFFNDTDFFDSKKKTEAFKVYMDKINNGSLEIRKTNQPNHAKMYLFEYKKEVSEPSGFQGKLITGSSNLSRSGLRDRPEVNVVLTDPRDYLGRERVIRPLMDKGVYPYCRFKQPAGF